MSEKKSMKSILLTVIVVMFILSGCSEVSQDTLKTSDQDAPDVRYSLKTETAGNELRFVGEGGDIEGEINPDLTANLGDLVEITLINDDGMMHDLTISEFNVATPRFFEKGQKETIRFVADQEGRFSYFCSLPGHRQSGQEGLLIVGENDHSNIEAEQHSVALMPDELPSPIDRSEEALVQVHLETIEVEARLSDGSTYQFWTFNGSVPGPFIRVRVGDTVEVTLDNAHDSHFVHSVDFHAVTGPGGGAVATQTQPGGQTSFTFKSLNPGIYVYHCATPMVAHHITNGMYGLILVEPEGGLPPVDHEFYVMQGELYTEERFGTQGLKTFSLEKMLDERPEYVIFNGAVDSLTAQAPLTANVGDTVRIFFGVGGPNLISSFHVIGEIFDRVYDQGSLTSEPLTDVQTTLVAPGGATMVEFVVDVPGNYLLVDHALSRLERGLVGFLIVEGPERPDIYDGIPTGDGGH